jgi:lysophospholipase L1-like esterase
MRNLSRHSLLPFLVATFLLILVSGCNRSYEETISDVKVPVPKAMTRSSEKPVEMTFLGFGAGQATFHGNMDTDKIVEFYKNEMPARGWQRDMDVRSGGAMLAYSKEGKTMLVAISKEKSETSLTLTVGGVGR